MKLWARPVPGESLEDPLDISPLLHGDDPELVLLVHPGQEGLLLVVEDAAALGPLVLHAAHLEDFNSQSRANIFPHLEVLIPGHEQEVVVDKLLPDLLVHAGEGEVGAGKVALRRGDRIEPKWWTQLKESRHKVTRRGSPVDDRPSTDKLHHFVQKKKKK